MYCLNCKQSFDGKFCPECGAKLIEEPSAGGFGGIHLGDANAISGGVNINQSRSVSHHDTHFHNTVHERAKSERELVLDAANQLRARAEEIMAERGRIDSAAMGELRPLALQLGIDDGAFRDIIKDVRTSRRGGSAGLSSANARYLLQAQQAVQTNDMDSLSNLTPRLEAMASISMDDNVQYLYHLTLCLLYPLKSVEIYERQTDENYWRTFWAIVSYIRTGRDTEATSVLAMFDPVRYEKSEDDQNLLEAYFHVMEGNNDEAQDFLDEILGETSAQVQPLLRAVEAKVYGDEPETPEVRFYQERIICKSDTVKAKTQKVPAEEPEVPAVPQAAVPQTAATQAPAVEPQAQNDLQKAQELLDQAILLSGEEKFNLLLQAAEMGLPHAQFLVSDALSEGGEAYGCKKDIFAALRWLEKACEADYPLALGALATVYLNVTGDSAFDEAVERDYHKAEALLLRAAKQDDKTCIKALMSLYNGVLSPDDPVRLDEVFRYAQKGANLFGDSDCMTIVGYCYLNADVINPIDEKQAFHWFMQAANQGDAEAMNMLGNLSLNSEAVGIDAAKAFKWYKKSAEVGNIDGMWNLACAYCNGNGVAQNMKLAEKWLQKAADGGQQEALAVLEDRKKNGETPKVESAKGAGSKKKDQVPPVAPPATPSTASSGEILNLHADCDGCKWITVHGHFIAHGLKGKSGVVEMTIEDYGGKPFTQREAVKFAYDDTEWTNFVFHVNNDNLQIPHNKTLQSKITFTVFYKDKRKEYKLVSKSRRVEIWYYFNFFSSNKLTVKNK